MSRRRGFRPLIASALAWAAVVAAAAGAGQAGIAPVEKAPEPAGCRTISAAGAPVTLAFRSLRPGEAILVRLNDDAAVRKVELALGEQIRTLIPAGWGNPGYRTALLGIDLGKSPRGMTLEGRTERLDGTTETFEIPLAIEPREFPSTRLDVAPSMAVPPKEEQETIRRESELVAEILGNVSPDWLAGGAFQSPLPAYEPYPNFGQRRIYNRTVSSIHNGVDISAPRGTAAAAPGGGRIVLASRLYFSGWTVIIDHGQGVFSYCCHFDKLLVKRGEAVRKGQAIGLVGSTGRSTGPHLHWAVRIAASRVDPFSLLVLPL
jgi:murein DD-endopeptidase MepM/ murein hydrolase activator NlpD